MRSENPEYKQWVHGLGDDELSACLLSERTRLGSLVKSEYDREQTLNSLSVMEQSARVDVLVNEQLLRSLEENL